MATASARLTAIAGIGIAARSAASSSGEGLGDDDSGSGTRGGVGGVGPQIGTIAVQDDDGPGQVGRGITAPQANQSPTDVDRVLGEPNGGVGVSATQHRLQTRWEPDGEFLDVDAEAPRSHKVAEFMHKNDDAQHGQRQGKRDQQARLAVEEGLEGAHASARRARTNS